MNDNNESLLIGYPNVISYECTKKIIEQMEKNIFKIKVDNGLQGTGFFCKIPYPNKNNMISVLITCNHLINEDILYKKDKIISIKIKEENEIRNINLNDRIKYSSQKYDITIIEIKEKDNINNFLELDDIITSDILNNKNENIEYIDKTIYIIQYPKGELSVSYGIIKNIYEKKYIFNHKCSTERGSSGSPIINQNNKIIGIHQKGVDKYNLGTFLNYPIKEFIQEYKINLNKNENEDIFKYKNNKGKKKSLVLNKSEILLSCNQSISLR